MAGSTRGPTDSPEAVRVLVACEQPLTRLGLRALLEEDPAFVVVGEAHDGHDALAACARMQLDLVVVDLHLPDVDGLTLTRALRSGDKPTRVLLFGPGNDPELRLRAAAAGAAGYVARTTTGADLRWAARAAALADDSPGSPAAGGKPRAVASRLPNQLSAREVEVLRLLADGCTNSQIAASLVITPNTVKAHVEHILSKLHVKDRTQAAVRAFELGYVSSTETSAARLTGISRTKTLI